MCIDTSKNSWLISICSACTHPAVTSCATTQIFSGGFKLHHETHRPQTCAERLNVKPSIEETKSSGFKEILRCEMSPSWWAATPSRKQGKDLQGRHAYRGIAGWPSASSARLPLHLCLTIANTPKRTQEDSQSIRTERVCHCRVLSSQLVKCEKDKSQSFKDPSCTEGFFFLIPNKPESAILH